MLWLDTVAASRRNLVVDPRTLSRYSLFDSSSLVNFCSYSRSHHEHLCIKPCRFSATENSPFDSFDGLLQQCTTISQIREVQSQILVTSGHHSAFLGVRLISVFAHFGCLLDAQKVFNTAPFDSLMKLPFWNCMLRANISLGHFENALELYVKMRRKGVLGDGFSFPLAIKACAFVGSWKSGRSIHGHVIQSGFQNHIHVANELLGFYTKLGKMNVARHVFDRMPDKNYISWNTMVSGFSRNFDCDGALEMFHLMDCEGLQPNIVTWTSLLSSHARCGQLEEAVMFFDMMRMQGTSPNAEVFAVVLSVCSRLFALEKGKAIQGHIIKSGFECYLIVKNALICLYGKHEDVESAQCLFSEIENQNIISWNSIITSFSEAGLCDATFAIFSQMERSNGCQKMRPNVISWTAVIDAFASNGRYKESLDIFRKMQLSNTVTNSVTVRSVLSACAELAALQQGREIHGHAVRASMDQSRLVANGLVNMYMKSGSLKEGHSVFERIKVKDIISWNSVIGGFGLHGHGENALATFVQMVKSGFYPDEVTFLAVLSACNHAGLVSQGRMLFDAMLRDLRIAPKVKHYACIVDLLSRAGFLTEGSDIVKNMPIQLNDYVWVSLLNACRMHENLEVADKIASQIFSFELEDTGYYMLLSNVYAANRRWDESARVRVSVKSKGLKKIPGQSWIEVARKVHMFSAGNTALTCSDEVYGVLEELFLQMRKEDYIFNAVIAQADP